MKITKRQLRRIIREEKARLHEVEYYGTPLDSAIKELMSILQGMDPMDRNSEIYSLIDDLEDLANRG